MTRDAAGDRAFFARAAEVFAAMRPLDAAARRARLAELAVDDSALAGEVGSLLCHDSASATMLDQPVVSAPAGTMIGRYRIVSIIGEGGMGTVFLAEQVEPVRRQVALKLIKLGMDTRAVVRRFEAERQVLARMEHPGIARIIDGGVAPDGRPYFVMELVRGEPITHWCDAHALDATARVRLFLEVCAAVQHAHQKGVIHRDLKPGNMLVAELEGRPMPKVIDFGVAKALDDDTLGATQSGHGMAMPGTPEYMSPEQAGLVPADGVDTRSDVFSLGVVLYELLTGSTPARARTRSGGVRRPTTLRPRLRRDLDAIILKAVAQEPSRRYATVAAFADDLTRYLRHEPVVARPASALYLTTQFARRHTLAIGAAALVLLALVTGLGMALWGLQRAREELFASTIERARLAGVVGDLPVAREALWRCYLEQPGSIHAAWALREHYFRYPTVWSVYDEGLRSAVLAPLSEDRVVIAGTRDPPRVHSVETGAVLMTCEPDPEDTGPPRPQSAAVSPDGTLLATADNDGIVRLWALPSGAFCGRIAAHGEGPAVAAFLADSRTLLTAGADGRVLRVPCEAPTAATLLSHTQPEPRSLTVHTPTGQAAAGLVDGSILYWKNLHEPPVHTAAQHTSGVYAIAFDHAGEQLASGSTDRHVVLWNTRDMSVERQFPTNNGTVRGLAYTADGALYILGWWHLARLSKGDAGPTPVVAEGGWRFVIPRDGEVVLVRSEEHAVCRWHTEARSLFTPVTADLGWRVCGTSVRDGAFILRKGATVMARTTTGETLWEHTHTAGVVSMAVTADGSHVAVGTQAGEIWLRGHAAAWQRIATDYDPGTSDTVAIDATGSHIAYRTHGDAVVVAPGQGGQPRVVLPESPNEQLVIHFARDGMHLCAAERNTGLRVLHLPTGRVVRHDCGQSAFAIGSADDGTIFLGGWRGTILTVSPTAGLLHAMRGHKAVVGALAVHPTDQNLVLTGSMDGTVRLWHNEQRRELQSLAPLGGSPISFVGFDLEGQRAVVGSSDGRTVTWPLFVADEYIRGNSPTR